jgi:hypothetical protein
MINPEEPPPALYQEESLYPLCGKIDSYDVSLGIIWVELRKKLQSEKEVGMLVSIFGEGEPLVRFEINY